MRWRSSLALGFQWRVVSSHFTAVIGFVAMMVVVIRVGANVFDRVINASVIIVNSRSVIRNSSRLMMMVILHCEV